MARLSFVLAVLAVVAAVSGAKTKKAKVFRQTCVDSYGQTKPDGSSWLEGVNGCLALTCTSGQAVGADYCRCTNPDATQSKTGDVWYSIPTCTTCSCLYGNNTCVAILNCILPAATTVVATATATATGTTCYATSLSQTLNVGDKYIEGCQECTCTASGFTCSGMVTCPTVVPTADTTTDCFVGFLGFIGSTAADEYVSTGEVVTGTCDTCTCTDGTFYCVNTCNVATTTAVVVVTTAEVTETVVVEDETADLDNDASLDCDVGDGIVVNGDSYDDTTTGETCTCVNGELDCPVVVVDPVDNTTTVSDIYCIALDGSSVANGGSYMSGDCTNCTCVNGVFTCMKVCDRDCTTTSGVAVGHGLTYTSTCSSCKCNDATLTCSNTCAGKTCKIPNSSTTLTAGQSKKIDSCVTCKCTSTILLQCRDNCDTSTVDCICNGKSLRSGKSTTTDCQKCTCNSGKLSCKNVC